MRPTVHAGEGRHVVVHKLSLVIRAILRNWFSVDAEILRMPADMVDLHGTALPCLQSQLVVQSMHDAFLSQNSHNKRQIWDKSRVELVTLSTAEYEQLQRRSRPLDFAKRTFEYIAGDVG